MDKNNKFLYFVKTAFPLLFLVPLAPYIGGLLFVSNTYEILFSLKSIIGLFVVSVLFVAGFNTFNAVYDCKIDLINKSFRSIPSKKLTREETLIFSIFCFGCALALGFLINLTFFALIFVNILLAVFYSLPPIRLKEKYFVSNIIIALTFGFFPVLMGWSVFGKTADINWAYLVSILVLYTSISFLKDFEDFLGDKIHNVKTLPTVLGFRSARKWTISSIVFAYFFIAALTFFNFFKPLSYVMVFFLFWIWYIDCFMLKMEKGLATGNADEITLLVLNMTLLGSISALCLAILNNFI